MSKDRLYSFNGKLGYGIHAGVSKDNSQVLIGLACPDLVAFLFDQQGKLKSVDSRPVPFLLNLSISTMPALIRC